MSNGLAICDLGQTSEHREWYLKIRKKKKNKRKGTEERTGKIRKGRHKTERRRRVSRIWGRKNRREEIMTRVNRENKNKKKKKREEKVGQKRKGQEREIEPNPWSRKKESGVTK